MVFFHGGGRAGREAQRRRVRPLAAVAHHPPLRHEALQLAQPHRVADHADRAAVVRGGALLAPSAGGLVGQVVAELGAAAVLTLLVRDDRREQRLERVLHAVLVDGADLRLVVAGRHPIHRRCRVLFRRRELADHAELSRLLGDHVPYAPVVALHAQQRQRGGGRLGRLGEGGAVGGGEREHRLALLVARLQRRDDGGAALHRLRVHRHDARARAQRLAAARRQRDVGDRALAVEAHAPARLAPLDLHAQRASRAGRLLQGRHLDLRATILRAVQLQVRPRRRDAIHHRRHVREAGDRRVAAPEVVVLLALDLERAGDADPHRSGDADLWQPQPPRRALLAHGRAAPAAVVLPREGAEAPLAELALVALQPLRGLRRRRVLLRGRAPAVEAGGAAWPGVRVEVDVARAHHPAVHARPQLRHADHQAVAGPSLRPRAAAPARTPSWSGSSSDSSSGFGSGSARAPSPARARAPASDPARLGLLLSSGSGPQSFPPLRLQRWGELHPAPSDPIRVGLMQKATHPNRN